MKWSRLLQRRWWIMWGNWNGGSFKRFWMKQNAIKYANTIISNRGYLFIELVDRWTDEATTIKDNPDGVPYIFGS